MCLNYTTVHSGCLSDSSLYSVTGEIVQAEPMFSSRARAGLEESFQQRLCVMLLGGLGFSGGAHPVRAGQYCSEQEWQIDLPVQANSDWWAGYLELCIEKDPVAASRF